MSQAPRKRLAAVPDVPPDGEGRAPASRTSKPTAPAAAAGGAHGPYSKPPRGRALLPGERQPMLAEVLQGVRLYAFDRQALDWLCRWLDTPTFLALLGIIERASQAAADRATAAAGEQGTPEQAGPPQRRRGGAR
jgi:hypothetical protein